MNRFHFFQKKLYFREVVTDLISLVGQRYGTEFVRTLSDLNNVLASNNCDRIEPNNLMDVLNASVLFLQKQYAHNFYSLSSESVGSSKEYSDLQDSCYARFHDGTDGGTDSSSGVSFETKSQIAEDERISYVYSGSAVNVQFYELFKPSEHRCGVSPTAAQDAQYGGSISSVRLQTDIQKHFPREYEHYIVNAYHNKFTLFLETELHLEAFVYSDAALRQDPCLSTHVGFKELRLKKSPTPEDTSSFFRVARWDSAMGAFLMLYWVRRYRVVVLDALCWFLKTVESGDMTGTEEVFLNPIETDVIQYFAPTGEREPSLKQGEMESLQLTTLLFYAFSAGVSFRKRTSRQPWCDRQELNALRSIRVCHLGTAVATLLSSQKYLHFMSRTKLRATSMWVLHQLLFPPSSSATSTSSAVSSATMETDSPSLSSLEEEAMITKASADALWHAVRLHATASS
ncbi:hypothetical protein ADEAN_000574400 [Angomonas deanei]|uniref:Uncharacterized protein n=1 Tax=Angomonas deanei TaxID=59799 RepID=A0A7G2CES2_9TRYP|nr:hypothetical protein ADEAN_000574400 [Angomonas deanei]